MPVEVFAWPEGNLWFYSAGAVSPAALAFVERVNLNVRWDWNRYRNLSTGTWASRSTFVLADKRVEANFGMLWSDSTALLRANSGSAWNLAYSATNPYQTGAWQIWSAVFTQFSLHGQANGLWRAQAQMEALDYSAI